MNHIKHTDFIDLTITEYRDTVKEGEDTNKMTERKDMGRRERIKKHMDIIEDR